MYYKYIIVYIYIYIYIKQLRRNRYDAFATPWQLAFGDLQGLAEADGTKWQVWWRLIISWYFLYLFSLFQWQDIFPAIQAVRLVRSLWINRRVNLVEEHAETHV